MSDNKSLLSTLAGGVLGAFAGSRVGGTVGGLVGGVIGGTVGRASADFLPDLPSLSMDTTTTTDPQITDSTTPPTVADFAAVDFCDPNTGYAAWLLANPTVAARGDQLARVAWSQYCYARSYRSGVESGAYKRPGARTVRPVQVR